MKFVSSKWKTQRSSFDEYHRRNVFTFKENFEKSKLLPTFVLFQNIATYICQFHISANQSYKIFIIMNIINFAFYVYTLFLIPIQSFYICVNSIWFATNNNQLRKNTDFYITGNPKHEIRKLIGEYENKRSKRISQYIYHFQLRKEGITKVRDVLRALV